MIDALQAMFCESDNKVYQINGIMRQIYIGFSKQCTVWVPFKNFKSLLTDPTRAKNKQGIEQQLFIFSFLPVFQRDNE